MSQSEEVTFKQTPQGPLQLRLFTPDPEKFRSPIGAIVFFFGGGWVGGKPGQFDPQAVQLAQRGILAACAEYRVFSRHGVSPDDCVRDAKSAVRWIRAHAQELGVDPTRIAAGGGSSGGHLAACTAMVKGYEDEPEEVSSRPDALVLFNPALYIDAPPEEPGSAGRLEKFGTHARALCPYHHVRPGLPPAIIFHGTADERVSFASADLFARSMQEAGNRCQLVEYPGAGHGFFNAGRGDGSAFRDTLAKAEQFLTSLRYLEESR